MEHSRSPGWIRRLINEREDGVPEIKPHRVEAGFADDVALARGLLLESTDGLRLVSELVADQELRVRLTRHVEELADLSEAWSTVASGSRAD